MSALWTSADAAAATGGQLHGPAWQINGLSIDSRTVASGELFIALTAARDGHDFVAQALAAGASAAMVSRIPDGVGPEAPLLIVEDVQAGLEALGRAGRARFGGKIAAVTGSVGKTTTKDMLRHMLARQGRVSAAQASYNNHWGVPLTLARLPVDAEFAVAEIGMNHPGEIAPLAQMVRPDVAAITAIAPAHLEAFGRLEGIAEEKASIFTGLSGGRAIIPDDAVYRDIFTAAAAGAPIWTFGHEEGSDFRLDEVRLVDDTTVVQLHAPFGKLTFKLGIAGRHLASNAVCALAMLHALGGDASVGAMDLAEWRPFAGRGTREQITLDPVEAQSFTLIDDAFNANPASVAAALEVLGAAKPAVGGRRVAILGDMLELGATEAADHAALADLIEKHDIDIVHTAGPLMRNLHEALPAARQGRCVEQAEGLKGGVNRLCKAGDVVLVKGSKGSRISIIATSLRALNRNGLGKED